MPGKQWTTEEQRTFLTDRIPQFLEAQASGGLTMYWPRIYREWFEKFPEKEVLFPGCDELSVEQEERLKKEFHIRRKVNNKSCINSIA
jgi:hypothetical protein